MASIYQVLESNIGPWTKKHYGRSLTASEFLANHEAQEAVARGVLYGYFKKWGAEGAAAAWFSGSPNPNSTKSDGYLTVRQYVDRVIKAAGGAPAGGGGKSSSSGGSPELVPITAKMDDKTLATYYGLSKKLIDSDASLKKIFKQAVKENWSPEVFTAHLKNTTWWTKNSDALRKYLTTKWSDPATWKQKWQATATKVNQIAVAVGVGSLLGKGLSPGKMNELLEKATYNVYALGWSEERVKDWLGSQVTTHGGVMWGEAGENFDKLHALAYANGMKYADSWYRDQAKAVVSGKKSFEELEAAIRKDAAARWKGFSTQIKAGMNAIDLASAYISSVSGLFEVPSSTIDLSNKYVAKAMSSTNKDGTPYSLWALENDVRADPRWRKTKNAQDSTSALARQVLTDFGFLA